MKRKIKPVLPSLREKKRYLVYEINSEGKIEMKDAMDAINHATDKFLGELGTAKAGIIHLKDWQRNKGIIRTNYKEIANVKGALSLITNIKGRRVIFKNIYVSGILSKARHMLAKEED